MSMKSVGKAAMAVELAKWCSKYGLPQVVSSIQETLASKFGRKLYVVISSGTPYIFHGSGSKEHFSQMWKESKKEALKQFKGTSVKPDGNWVIEEVLKLMKDRGFVHAEYVWLVKS